jgi:hypothetical protein
MPDLMAALKIFNAAIALFRGNFGIIGVNSSFGGASNQV